MTTSISSEAPGAEIDARATRESAQAARAPSATPDAAGGGLALPPVTMWSRLVVFLLCAALVLSTLAFGTVHAWSLALLLVGAGLVVLFWTADAWRTGALRLSRNLLQLPLLGLIAVALLQLLPLGGSVAPAEKILRTEPARTFSFDPYATSVVAVQLIALLVYFAAALAFVDTPKRLRLLARTITVFGFLLAVYALAQHFLNPSAIYWLREPKQAEPFGPFINRHHFAGYMELTLALPLGLLLSGAVGRERAPLYGFAVAIMCIALVMTNSRGGMLSMAAEIFFLVAVTVTVRHRRGGEEEAHGGVRAAAAQVALAFVMIAVVLAGALYFGGEASLSRLIGTVNAADPTTGRTHFWKGTLAIIADHPLLGTGLGAFAAVYPRYDTAGGAFRLEQAHNDYLQLISDAGLVGGLLGLLFVAALFRMAFARVQTRDKFRRGVALGALTGCAGVLVHSFFDFTLHTTANALLFLVLAALATINGRVEEAKSSRPKRRRRRTHVKASPAEDAPEREAATA